MYLFLLKTETGVPHKINAPDVKDSQTWIEFVDLITLRNFFLDVDNMSLRLTSHGHPLLDGVPIWDNFRESKRFVLCANWHHSVPSNLSSPSKNCGFHMAVAVPWFNLGGSLMEGSKVLASQSLSSFLPRAFIVHDLGGGVVVHCLKLLLESGCPPQDHDKLDQLQNEVGSIF
ncbi:hypothetical protein Tco_1481971 [Tanacetum coccineum]